MNENVNQQVHNDTSVNNHTLSCGVELYCELNKKMSIKLNVIPQNP